MRKYKKIEKGLRSIFGKVFKVSCFSFFFLSPLTLLCGENSLTLQAAEEEALQNNEMINALRENVEASRLRRLSSLSTMLPSATISGQYTKQEHVSTTSGVGDRTTATLSLSQPLLVSDLYFSSEESRLNFEGFCYDYEKMRNDLLFEVRDSYYQLLLAEEELKVEEENIEILTDAMRLEEKKMKVGKSTKFEVNQSRVALANAFSTYYQAKKAVKAKRNRLARLLGRSVVGGKEYTLAEKKFPVLEIEALQEKLRRLGMLAEEKKENEGNEENFLVELGRGESLQEELIFSREEIVQWKEIALRRRPNIKKAKTALELTKNKIDQKWSNYLPEVSAFGSYEKSYPKGTTLFSSTYDNWSGGVQFSWNLFDSFGRERNVREAYALNRAALFDYEREKEETFRDIEDRVYNIEESLLAYYAARKGVFLAKEAIVEARERLKLGLFTSLDYRDVVLEQMEAKQNFNRASYQLLSSYYALRQAVALDTFSSKF